MRKLRLGLIVPLVGLATLFGGVPGAQAQITTIGTTTIGTTDEGTTTIATTTIGTTGGGGTTPAPTPDVSGIGFATPATAIGGVPSFTG